MQFLITTFDKGTVKWSLHSDVLKDEARCIFDLCQKDIVRNIWFSEKKDAVLIMECETREKAEAIVRVFPLVQADLIEFEITELHPYTGLARILDAAGKPASS